MAQKITYFSTTNLKISYSPLKIIEDKFENIVVIAGDGNITNVNEATLEILAYFN
ncbi:MAG: hypothetical protein IPK10_17495 [Bacteroidetes bacterium]|nr:hypothetical protein [Bacteroidota bacterium]